VYSKDVVIFSFSVPFYDSSRCRQRATFAEIHKHAEAQQKSMLAMIDNAERRDWAYPKFWAVRRRRRAG
jgi:hypothetical protein